MDRLRELREQIELQDSCPLRTISKSVTNLVVNGIPLHDIGGVLPAQNRTLQTLS